MSNIISKKDLKRNLVPSLPAKSFEEIAALLLVLRGCTSAIQIDIVDGEFAPDVSWPFTEKDASQALEKLSAFSDFEIEMDCMCMHPEAYLNTFVRLGVKRVVIHVGSTEEYLQCVAHARKNGYLIGLGIKDSTPASLYDTLISYFDFVQVMGIEHIGVQGQPFDERTPGMVATLRQKYPDLEIAVDGGVNEKTIPLLLSSGVDRFAPGSAITKAEDPCASYRHLADMVGL